MSRYASEIGGYDECGRSHGELTQRRATCSSSMRLWKKRTPLSGAPTVRNSSSRRSPSTSPSYDPRQLAKDGRATTTGAKADAAPEEPGAGVQGAMGTIWTTSNSSTDMAFYAACLVKHVLVKTIENRKGRFKKLSICSAHHPGLSNTSSPAYLCVG
jgi:hypothetical protein